MQVPRKKIEANLATKGFIKEKTHHTYFYHEYKGKRTGAYTYTSHGSNYKNYGISLLKRMKTELRLDTITQVARLCECPMKEKEYINILKNKNII